MNRYKILIFKNLIECLKVSYPELVISRHCRTYSYDSFIAAFM